MKIITLMVLLLITQAALPQTNLSKEDKAFLDTLQYHSFQYFMKEINPRNGLVKDRSQEGSPASTAAAGWGVTVWAIGSEHNWISREKAAKLTLNLLRFLDGSEQSTAQDATGYQGFYYHFLNMDTGKREWNCELSTIDTAWLLAGIRLAVQYYNKNNQTEKEIRQLGDKLTNRVNWDYMIIKEGRTPKHTGLISMAWKPEEGVSNFGWYGYTEALYLYVLAAGTNLSNPKDAYSRWQATYTWKEPYKGLGHVVFPPLFGHQYSQMFINSRHLRDSYMSLKGIDYFENSRRATLTNRIYCIDNPRHWKGYDSLTWGISACDGPGDKYNNGSLRFEGYAGRGTSGPDSVYVDDGTITPTAAASSIIFAPEIIIPTLKNMYNNYGSKGLWDKYGFKDAFNPTAGWYDPDYLGLDQGPIVIMIENFRNGFVWKYSMKDPVIKRGLERLGFKKGI